ncbi:MAG: hypothetical protein KDD34_02180 [Bdellovibrionales bacterium]|nr:hypothetical protein [Bdellovibrionales bacterium]
MSYFLYLLGFLAALVLILNYLILPQLLINYLKDQIQLQASKKEYQVQLSSIKMNALFPFYLQVNGISVQNAISKLEIKKIQISAHLNFSAAGLLLSTELNVQEPRGSLILKDEKQENLKPMPSSNNEEREEWFHLPFPLQVKVVGKIQEGELLFQKDKIQNLTLNQFNITFSNKNLLNSQNAWSFDWATQARVSMNGAYHILLPVHLKSNTIYFNPQFLKIHAMKASVGGIQADASGESHFHLDKHLWKLKLNIEALEKLPVPPQFLPPGQWQGGLFADVSVTKKQNSDWEIQSQLKTRNLSGNINLKQGDLIIEGPLRADLQWQVQYKQGALSAPTVKVIVEADKLKLQKKNYLHKNSGEPLTFHLDGYVTKNVLVAKSFQARLAQLKVIAGGYLGLEKGLRSEIQLEIPRTNLKGLEKTVPILGHQPVQGELSVKANIKGDMFQGLDGLEVDANPVRLSAFRTNFNLRDDKNKIYLIGPLTANLSALVKTQGAQLGTTTVQGDIDVSKVEVQYKDLFSKKMGEPFRLKLRLGNRGENLAIENSSMSLGKGELSLSGKVSGFSDPRFQLNFLFNKFPLHQVLKMTKSVSGLDLTGDIDGRAAVEGHWENKKGIEGSKIKVNAKLNTQMSHFIYNPKQKQNETLGEGKKTSAMAPLVPHWPVLKNSQLELSGRIQKFQYENISGRGLAFKSNYNKGLLSLSATVKQLFEGEWNLNQLTTNLLASHPQAVLKAKVKGFSLQPALKVFAPQYSSDASGKLSGQFDISSKLPGGENFLSSIKGLVAIDGRDVLLNSIKFDAAINEALKRLPKINLKPVKTEGFRGKFSCIAGFRDNMLNISKLTATTIKNDELDLIGRAGLDGSLDLKGKLSMVRPSISGDIYICNLDEKGRFELPIVMSGRWTQPNLGFASSTIEKLLANTLRCQLKKQKLKAEQNLKQELDQTTKKITDDFEKEAKKKLKNFFKK